MLALKIAGAIEFCVIYIVPVMLGLRVSDAQKYTDFVLGRDCKPLIEIAERTNGHGFNRLLSNNETYDKCETQKTFVTLSDKLESVYDAVFVRFYDNLSC